MQYCYTCLFKTQPLWLGKKEARSNIRKLSGIKLFSFLFPNNILSAEVDKKLSFFVHPLEKNNDSDKKAFWLFHPYLLHFVYNQHFYFYQFTIHKYMYGKRIKYRSMLLGLFNKVNLKTAHYETNIYYG